MTFHGEQQDLFAAHTSRAGMDSFGHADDFRLAAFSGAPLQVYLVAPPLVGWGLTRLVQTAGSRFSLVGSSVSMQEATHLLERNPPDAVILDLDDGYSIDDLRDFYATTRVKILVLTSKSDEAFLSEVLNAGARGVLHKREAPSAVLRALDAIGEGRMFTTAAATEHLFMAAARTVSQSTTQERAKGRDGDASKIASLTIRERETIAALVENASAPVKVIAGRLCISEHTLRNHLTSIYSKLGVTGRLGLHAFASQHDLSASTHAHGRYR